MAAQLEDGTLKIGLLMEAAQAQQSLAASALERLHEHAAGLDAIVREEIRATILEEMRALADDTRHAAEALRGLRSAATLRLAAWSAAMLTLSALVPCAIAGWWLPTRPEIDALGAARDHLAANIAHLAQQGGRMELRHCGAAHRLCVRIDRNSPAYGDSADFRVVQGY
jgi:hypothetical protein